MSIKEKSMSSCCSNNNAKPALIEKKAAFMAVLLTAIVAASFVLPWLVPFRHALRTYMGMMGWAIVVGFILGGIIDYYVPREYVARLLARPKKRTVLYSVFLGFLMTVCNHGVLAIAMQFYKKGAATSSVIAFLLASPWANFPLTLMMIGFFGPAKGLFLIVAAIVIAVITGLVFQLLENRGIVDKNPHTPADNEKFSCMADMRARLAAYQFSGPQAVSDIKGIARGVKELADMTLGWLLIGVAFASLASAYVPPHFFHHYMGHSFGGMVTTLVAAAFVETCSTGMSPLAFEIYRQTGALGNALVFLMAGVVTNYTAIGLIWVNIGRRTAMAMPLVCVPLVLLVGWLANSIFG